MIDHFRAACYAQDLVRHAVAADALQHVDVTASLEMHGHAIADLVKTAEALGFVVIAKAKVAA